MLQRLINSLSEYTLKFQSWASILISDYGATASWWSQNPLAEGFVVANHSRGAPLALSLVCDTCQCWWLGWGSFRPRWRHTSCFRWLYDSRASECDWALLCLSLKADFWRNPNLQAYTQYHWWLKQCDYELLITFGWSVMAYFKLPLFLSLQVNWQWSIRFHWCLDSRHKPSR